jgi:hypothetical protein
MRPAIDDFKLHHCGFQVVPHASKCQDIATLSDVESYQRETEAFLTELLGADKVICYEFKVCQNRQLLGGGNLESKLRRTTPVDHRSWTGAVPKEHRVHSGQGRS